MRESICLNGEWDFMPVYGVRACLDLPEEVIFEKEKIRVPSSWRYVNKNEGPYFSNGYGIIDEFQPFNLFNYPEEWSKAETGVFRRVFSVPDNMKGSRIFLRFDGLMQLSRVFLNGKVVGQWDEAYLPLRIDITDYVLKDSLENELLVVCTTFDEYEDIQGRTKALGLVGSWFGFIGRGIWQDVTLETSSITYIEDAFVKTSVREHSIDLKLSVKNSSDLVKTLIAKITVFDAAGQTAFQFDSKEISVNEGETVDFTMKETWMKPCLWDIDNPYLYTMQIDLHKDDLIVDTKIFRFGFRELWNEGSNFILNGTRINLRGDSWHFQGAIQQTKEYAVNWFLMCKEKGLNFVRLHAEPHPEYYLEAADETGILIVDETAIYGSTDTMPADHPVFLEMCKNHIKRLVARDKNHPSVVIWSLQNEMRWVSGRDDYKQHIPEMMEIFRSLDGSRPIIIEGDNRLLAKQYCDMESYHYNIDGTLAQWDGKKPLVFGEHGGWWYICPQNTSAFVGLKAYSNIEHSIEGMAIKERLYVESARRSGVSGITSFNFAHYMMKSMPDEDIYLPLEALDTPGPKPKVLRKHSMTINNGRLSEYPQYRPNTSMEILSACYKKVTIIPTEYDSSFYDDAEIHRSFDVYNDTISERDCIVEIFITLKSGEVIKSKQVRFTQGPGERENVEITFLPPKVEKCEKLLCKIVLFHDGVEMFQLEKVYKLYPKEIKETSINTNDKSIAYWGRRGDYEIIKKLIPSCDKVDNLAQVELEIYDILIIGSYIDQYAIGLQKKLGQFIQRGGRLIQLEQSKFATGDLSLVKQSFFSAHINDKEHELLRGLEDEDLIFWSPLLDEEIPRDIVLQCFVKPVKGDFNIILESSSGDFGDGGDLWTPLIEHRYGKGIAILNQLELMENYNCVPQAAVLLRNMLEYVLKTEQMVENSIGLLAPEGGHTHCFLEVLGLEYQLISKNQNIFDFKVVIADMGAISEEEIKGLEAFTNKGGTVLMVPVSKEQEKAIENLLHTKVSIKSAPVYQLRRSERNPIISGVSIVDLFRFEKVTCSPRAVENTIICENAIEIEGARELLISANENPWFDYFVRKEDKEYSKIALIDINKNKASKDLPYLVVKENGKGCVILSQISIDSSNEKNIRIYSRILSNLGGVIKSNAFSFCKGDRDYSIDYFMTLQHPEHLDYKKAEEYYTDKDYSLNNLGEGVYGWMKKIEKDKEDGFIYVPQSRGKRFFLTCFVKLEECKDEDKEQRQSSDFGLALDMNCPFKLFVNGELIKMEAEVESVKRVTVDSLTLTKGINRFVITASAGNEDICFRPILKSLKGEYADNLRYQLTINEVDPK